MAPTRRVGALLLMTLLIALGQEAAAGSLDRIRQDKTLRIAYREDAPPFSYKNNIGEPAGLWLIFVGRSLRNLPNNFNCRH